MDITPYLERLNLGGSNHSRIDHDDAIVAVVYEIIGSDGTRYILKICEDPNHYHREVYFLQHFANQLPVPQIINIVPPKGNLHGAVLMEYLPGQILKMADYTDQLVYEMGSLLALIHKNRTSGYGDLILAEGLKSDPRSHFTSNFHKGINECKNHLPEPLIKQCLHYFNQNIDLLTKVDGPSITHRDFRAGNVIIDGGKIRGVIDWSSGRSGFAEDDFCTLEHSEWASHPKSKKAFLQGYSSIREVPDYRATMPLLCMNRAIAIIGFTLRRRTWDNSNAPLYQSNRFFLESFFRN